MSLGIETMLGKDEEHSANAEPRLFASVACLSEANLSEYCTSHYHGTASEELEFLWRPLQKPPYLYAQPQPLESQEK